MIPNHALIEICPYALQNLGLPALHAHLFVFWYALLSTITPPVCGTVFIASAGGGAEAARDFIARLTEEVELGKVYPGTVVSIREFGAFLEVLPGTEALCHVSELSMEYVNDPAEVCKMGDVMDVKVIGIDDQGKVKVSRKAVIDPDWQPPAPRERRGGGGDRGRGGDRRGGGAPRGEGGPKKFVKRKRRED